MTNAQIEAPAQFIPITAISFSDSSGNSVTASSDSPLPVSGTVAITAAAALRTMPATLTARDWPLGSTLDATGYSTVRIQVDSLFGGDAIVFAGSLRNNGQNYPWQVVDQAGNAYFGISAPGIYTMQGQSYLVANQTGSASTPGLTVVAVA